MHKWLTPTMYLDAFLEVVRVFDVTNLVFFCLGFRLLLLEFWCAPRFYVVLLDWCGVAWMELCCCVYEWMNVLLVLAWGVTFGLDWCILVWDGANWVVELVLAWDGAFGLKLGLLDWYGALGVARLYMLDWGGAPGLKLGMLDWYGALGVDGLCMLDWGGSLGVELKLCMLAYKQEIHTHY